MSPFTWIGVWGPGGRWDEVVGTREDLEWGGVACEPGGADRAVATARGAHARDVDEVGVGLDHAGQPTLDSGQHVDHAGEGHEVLGLGPDKQLQGVGGNRYARR